MVTSVKLCDNFLALCFKIPFDVAKIIMTSLFLFHCNCCNLNAIYYQRYKKTGFFTSWTCCWSLLVTWSTINISHFVTVLLTSCDLQSSENLDLKVIDMYQSCCLWFVDQLLFFKKVCDWFTENSSHWGQMRQPRNGVFFLFFFF